MSEQEIRSCLEKLEDLLSEINVVKALFENKDQLFGAEKKLAQEKFKAFKKKLDNAYRVIDTHRGQATLSETEKNYYATAIRTVRNNIRFIKTNSAPDARWRSALNEAAKEVNWQIDPLRDNLNK